MKRYKLHKSNDNEFLVQEPNLEYGSSHKCLYCYEPLEDTNASFHFYCNKKFFNQPETPLLDYAFSDLEKLATQVLQSQMAVTGVQAKVSLSYHKKYKNEAKKLTIVGLHGDYILKPPSEYYAHLPEVESMTMHLADVCGLKTVPHTLVYLADGTLCYLTKRVDRTKDGILHMEDMCQLSERLTEDKYKGSYEQIAKKLLAYSDAPLLDVTNFYEVVLFCFFTGNADMHLKNFSLLEKPNLGMTLSPAYDLVATALVNKADTEELALTLNGKKKKLTYKDFVAAYENSGLSKKLLDKTLDNFYTCKWYMEDKLSKSFLPETLKNEMFVLLNQRFKKLFDNRDKN